MAVEIKYKYYPNGNIRFERHYKDGELHRDPDENGKIKPALLYYDENRKILHKDYYKNGKFHREPKENGKRKPARLNFDKYGNIKRKMYFLNGEFDNNNDNPAIIDYLPNGNIRYENYVRISETQHKVQLHRDGAEEFNDKPSRIIYDEDGNLKRKEYHFEGKLIGKKYYKNKKLNSTYQMYRCYPAQIEYNDDGSIDYQEYLKNGEYHRDPENGIDKPAFIKYYESNDEEIFDGRKIMYESYWFNGKQEISETKPVFISYHRNQKVKSKMFLLPENKKRIENYDENGNIIIDS